MPHIDAFVAEAAHDLVEVAGVQQCHRHDQRPVEVAEKPGSGLADEPSPH